jgi:hypothetical protein
MRPHRAIVAAMLLIAGLLEAGAAGAQPATPENAAPPAAPASPAQPPATPLPAPSAAELQAYDRQLERTCYRRLTADGLARWAEARRAQGHEPAALFRGAPETMLALARLYRQGGDFANAAQTYDGLLAATADEARRTELARERAAMAEEQALLAGGVARPDEGALLVTLRDAPGAGGPYRVGLWAKPDCTPFAAGDGRSLLVLYRATGSTLAAVGSPVASSGGTFLFEDEGWGSDLTGDGRPVMTVYEANGGNCWACTRLRLYVASPSRLAALPVDAPDFVIPQAVANVGNRRLLVANDVRWESFGDVCHACAPGVAVVLAWRNGRFEQACREAPDYYRQRLGELAAGLADREPQFRFGAITSRLLIRIQIGEAEQAWPEYRHALAVLRRLRGGPRNGFRGAESQLAAALRAARPAMASAACPVNALTIR